MIKNKCEHVPKNNKQEIDIFLCVYCTIILLLVTQFLMFGDMCVIFSIIFIIKENHLF